MEIIYLILIFIIFYLILSSEEQKPKQYEISIITFYGDLEDEDNKNKLNKLQSEGWEIAGEIKIDTNVIHGLYSTMPFKRLIK